MLAALMTGRSAARPKMKHGKYRLVSFTGESPRNMFPGDAINPSDERIISPSRNGEANLIALIRCRRFRADRFFVGAKHLMVSFVIVVAEQSVHRDNVRRPRRRGRPPEPVRSK
jgi:hypothetical protein